VKLKGRFEADYSMQHAFTRKYDLLFQPESSMFARVESSIQAFDKPLIERPPKYLVWIQCF
jgi:hypothetical protein